MDNMTYKMAKKMVKKYGLTEEVQHKLSVLYMAGQLTDEEYNELMSMGDTQE